MSSARRTKQSYRAWSQAAPPSAAARPPPAFGRVERGVYRSGPPTRASVPFLARLRLSNALFLSAEHLQAEPRAALSALGVAVSAKGTRAWSPGPEWRPVNSRLLKEALEFVADARNHPVLLVCASGSHETGAVVACLRRMQGWGLTAALEEYRRFAGPRASHAVERAVECFDLGLVTVDERRQPAWLAEGRAADRREREGPPPPGPDRWHEPAHRAMLVTDAVTYDPRLSLVEKEKDL